MKNAIRIFAFAVLSANLGAQAGDVSLDKFKAMPILDGGRVKPLDTYARISLLQLSAKSTYKGEPAIHWLARLMFTPRDAQDDKVFRINNPDVAYALGMEPQADNRYSFAQLSPSFSKLSELANAAMKVEEKKRSPLEAELARLANNASLYMSLQNAFLFCVPHPDFRIDTATALALGMKPQSAPFSYMDLRGHMGQLAAIVQPIMGGESGHGSTGLANHGRDPATWTASQMGAMRLFQTFREWSEQYRDYPLPIIPPGIPPEGGTGMWISPWAMISKPNFAPEYRQAVSDLQAMGVAFAQGSDADFNQAVSGINAYVTQRGATNIQAGRIGLELFYNRLDPFTWAKILYGLAILTSLIAIMLMRRWTYWPGVVLLGIGAAIHATGIGLRVGIGGRAPITNLFETFLFVACVGAALGLVLEFYNRKGFGVLVGAVTGFSILLLSGRYDTDGDTIGVLVAVLNSNFWLTTHVITISLGYAGMCMAGVLGHLFLIQRIWNGRAAEKLEALMRMLYALLAFGLIFSFIGTVLGGVWADQSWGRFWGWDPKENGALMIVLWGSILFHAKAGKMLGPLGVAVGSVLGIIVVMMAWFGINLLGVGLHSYGFTSGVATALSVYVASETVFLLGAMYWIARQSRGTIYGTTTRGETFAGF